MKHERIKARDIEPGMRVARARSHPFHEVRTVQHTERSAVIELARQTGGGRVKPRLDADWWREISSGEEIGRAYAEGSVDRSAVEHLDHEPQAASRGAHHANLPSAEHQREDRFWTQPASYNADIRQAQDGDALDDWTAVVDKEVGVIAYFADADHARMFADDAETQHRDAEAIA